MSDNILKGYRPASFCLTYYNNIAIHYFIQEQIVKVLKLQILYASKPEVMKIKKIFCGAKFIGSRSSSIGKKKSRPRRTNRYLVKKKNKWQMSLKNRENKTRHQYLSIFSRGFSVALVSSSTHIGKGAMHRVCVCSGVLLLQGRWQFKVALVFTHL